MFNLSFIKNGDTDSDGFTIVRLQVDIILSIPIVNLTSISPSIKLLTYQPDNFY